MSDEETFETADSGAAHCVPIKAGDLKKGSYAVIKGKPCKVSLWGGRRRRDDGRAAAAGSRGDMEARPPRPRACVAMRLRACGG